MLSDPMVKVGALRCPARLPPARGRLQQRNVSVWPSITEPGPRGSARVRTPPPGRWRRWLRHRRWRRAGRHGGLTLLRRRPHDARLRLLIASGGDDRIPGSDPVTRRNRYGAPATPAPDELWFSSSTACAISSARLGRGRRGAGAADRSGAPSPSPTGSTPCASCTWRLSTARPAARRCWSASGTEAESAGAGRGPPACD